MVVFAAGFQPGERLPADAATAQANGTEPAARPIKVNKRFKLLLAVETS
jgi:hypothetical protein